MFESDWQLLLIREGEAMLEASGAEPFALAIGGQIEFTKPDVVAEPHDGQGSDVAPVTYDLEEWLLAKMGLVHLHLKRLVPSPAFRNVRPHRCALDFKRIAKRVFALRHRMELNDGQQFGEGHLSVDRLPGRTHTDKGLPGASGQAVYSKLLAMNI